MAIKKTFRKFIKNRFIKTTVLDEFDVDGVTYRVVDKTSVVPFFDNCRALCFKNADGADKIYIHSMVYHNEKKHYQPIYLNTQKVIELWNEEFSPRTALVLGAGGCSIPRFIAFNYPEIKTVGIEYCREMYETAQKYFFVDKINDRFTLLLGDAFDYVENGKIDEKQDIVFVDIFVADDLPFEKIFTKRFMDGIYSETGDESIVIFNLLSTEKEKAVSFAENSESKFDEKAVVVNAGRTLLVLAKSYDREKLSGFMKKLENIGEVTEI